MLGAIIGDIVGSRFEFDNHRSKDFKLFTPDCIFTDDSVMTLAVAKAVMEAARAKPADAEGWGKDDCARLSGLAVRHMQDIGRRYPYCGYGGMFHRWVFSDDPKPYNSFGNGAAMRVSAAGFAATDVWEAEQIAEAVTVVTHDHEEGVKGAKATAAAVALARRGALKSEIREHITRVYYPLDFRIDDIRDTYTFNETCQGTVPQAIECFLESASFGDAIRTAISLGGDSDTLAAITGAIAQAYYGVPDDIRKQALSYLDDYLRGILGEWERFAPPDAERFRVLTKYIGKIGRDYSLGDVYADARGAPGRAFGATSGNMDAIASEFAWELAQFSERHPEYALHRYDELLKSRGLKTPGTTAPSGDIGALDEQGVLALLMAVSGPDRIRDGTLTRHMENGAVAAWLKRLKDLG